MVMLLPASDQEFSAVCYKAKQCFRALEQSKEQTHAKTGINTLHTEENGTYQFVLDLKKTNEKYNILHQRCHSYMFPCEMYTKSGNSAQLK